MLNSEHVTQAAVLGVGFGGPVALLLAATHPERVQALVLVNSYCSLLRSDDYPIGVPAQLWDRFGQDLVEPGLLPRRTTFLSWRRAWSPTLSSRRGGAERDIAPRARRRPGPRGERQRSISDPYSEPCAFRPSSSMHATTSSSGSISVATSQDHVPNATYVELDTADHVPWASDADFVGEIEEFLTGDRHLAPSGRLLATVLFTDIVNSTQQAAAFGDQVWRDRLDLHDRAVDRQLAPGLVDIS